MIDNVIFYHNEYKIVGKYASHNRLRMQELGPKKEFIHLEYVDIV